MTKKSALGDSLFIGSTDVSGDVGSVQAINNSRVLLEVTGINKSAPERILGRADGEISFTSFWNTATGARTVLDDLPTTDVIVSFADGATAGSPAASIVGKQVNFDTAVGADGSIVANTTVKSNGAAAEWGVMLTAGSASFAGTASGTAVDGSASSSRGGAAYLHLFSIGAGTATFVVEHSSTGTSAWSTVTGLSFTASSTATAQRVATAAGLSISRYTRTTCTNPGGGTAVAFVNFVRN